MTPPACPRGRLADGTALRLACRRRSRRQPSMALAGILALASVAGSFAGARAFAGVDSHALNALRRLLSGSGRNGHAAQCERDRRSREGRTGNDVDFHVDLLGNSLA
jgi:hypothetical protein